MTIYFKITSVLIFLLASVAYSQENNIDILLKKYVGDVRYKNVISDEVVDTAEGKFRHLLVEVGGYHAGRCGSGPCGCAEKSELYLFAIPKTSEEKEKVNYQTLRDDCNGGPILVVKKRDGHVVIGEEKFITKFIYNRGELQGAFTDVQLAK